MKTKTQVSAVLIGTLLATSIASVGFAQNAGNRDERRAEMFATLDADKDGNISVEEFESRPDRFARADADGNGLLTAAELAALGEERAERRAARMIERLDTNEDGAVSREELDARRDPARVFSRLDANDDGLVSAEEFAEARMERRGGGHRGGRP